MKSIKQLSNLSNNYQNYQIINIKFIKQLRSNLSYAYLVYFLINERNISALQQFNRQFIVKYIIQLKLFAKYKNTCQDCQFLSPIVLQMFSLIIIILQLLLILMMGIFFRSSTFNTQSSYITYGLVLLLGFSLMYTPFRKLSLFSLVLLILVTFISIETYFLFGAFWISCFKGFHNNYDFTVAFIVQAVYGALAALITSLDFIALFQYWQVYIIISFVMTIGYSLASAVLVYGLNAYDGGGGIIVFLYSAVCSLVIWFLSVRGKISLLQNKKSESYINYTFVFIGVAISFFSWPILNMGGSLITLLNTSLASTDTSLSSSAYINTFSALGVSLVLSMILSSSHSQQQKMKASVYVECFVNSGIIVATYNDICLDPVCGMALALLSTILTLILEKKLFQNIDVRNQSDVKIIMLKFSKFIFRIIFSFIGVSVASIVIVTRSSKSLALLSTDIYSTRAGLTFAAWFIVLAIAVVFGLIAAMAINFYLNHRYQAIQKQQKTTKIIDELFFDDLRQQIFPIYVNILQNQNQNIYEQDLTRRVLQESLLKQQKIPLNIYQTNKKPSNHDTNESRIGKQTLVIKNDLSKSNLFTNPKEFNLSVMKIIQPNKDQVALENEHISRDSPIKKLTKDQNRFQSLRPIEKLAQRPRQMQMSPSISRLSDIHVIEQTTKSKNYLKAEQAQISQGNSSNFKKKLTYSDKVENQIPKANGTINN